MPFINIFIENECSISVKNNKLKLCNKDKEVEYPIEDINCVLIDCLYNTISCYAINCLCEKGSTILLSNEYHLPSTIVLPFNKYYKKLSVIKKQLSISKPSIKSLWQSIIKKKISGQAECLKINGKENYEKLLNLSKKVTSGDSNNIEATASAIYFKSLFGEDFNREQDCLINACLNYSYSIVRSLICRHLSARGFECSIGIFHSNQLNNFNLADDIIEPFRPIIDNFVINTIGEEKELNSALKRKLFTIVNLNVVIDGCVHSLSNAVEKMVESLLQYYDTLGNIIMPSIYNTLTHQYE